MDFDELYQDVILDHSRRPRNFGEMPDATCHIHGDNPNCGDEITLHVKFDAEWNVEAIKFTGHGCSICMASASMLTGKIRKKSHAEVKAIMHTFLDLLTDEKEMTPPRVLGDLALLVGVRKFPLRVKCATLAWHALQEALDKRHDEHFSVDPTETVNEDEDGLRLQ